MMAAARAGPQALGPGTLGGRAAAAAEAMVAGPGEEPQRPAGDAEVLVRQSAEKLPQWDGFGSHGRLVRGKGEAGRAVEHAEADGRGARAPDRDAQGRAAHDVERRPVEDVEAAFARGGDDRWDEGHLSAPQAVRVDRRDHGVAIDVGATS